LTVYVILCIIEGQIGLIYFHSKPPFFQNITSQGQKHKYVEIFLIFLQKLPSQTQRNSLIYCQYLIFLLKYETMNNLKV